jgi:hypothetical protein
VEKVQVVAQLDAVDGAGVELVAAALLHLGDHLQRPARRVVEQPVGRERHQQQHHENRDGAAHEEGQHGSRTSIENSLSNIRKNDEPLPGPHEAAMSGSSL